MPKNQGYVRGGQAKQETVQYLEKVNPQQDLHAVIGDESHPLKHEYQVGKTGQVIEKGIVQTSVTSK